MKYLKVFILLLIFVCGCAIQRRSGIYLPEGKFHLAILPVANETTNLDGPVLLRRALYKRLREEKGLEIMKIEDVDLILKDIGITDAGQLSSIDTYELSTRFPVLRIVYLNLVKFKPLRIDFEVIKVEVRVYNAITGKQVWNETFSVAPYKARDEASSLKNYFSGVLSTAFFEKIFRRTLSKEINIITERISNEICRRW